MKSLTRNSSHQGLLPEQLAYPTFMQKRKRRGTRNPQLETRNPQLTTRN